MTDRTRLVRLQAPGGLDGLRLDETVSRLPDPGEIMVRLRAASLNFHDYLVVLGKLPAADGRIPLSDAAGEVVALGPGVDAFRVGDPVVSLFLPEWRDGKATRALKQVLPGDRVDGYARETVTAPAHYFTRAPVGWSFAEAATLPCAALTAWRALFAEAELSPGETVLVQGTGGVSIFALQFAKAAGAQVIATSSSDSKLARLRALGADQTLNYREDANWGETSRRLAGAGVDVVVEVGGAGTMAQSIEACGENGRVAVIGVLADGEAAVPMAKVMAKQLKLLGVTVGNRAQQLEMIAWLEQLDLRPVIDVRRFDLVSLADAFRHQAAGGHFGKIVVDL